MLKEMKESKLSQTFESTTFHIAGFPWRIVVCPNGHKKEREGCFGVFVKLMNMPSEWDSIQCCIRAQCNETMASGCIISPYQKGQRWKWPGRTMLFSEIQTLNSLSISVHIFVTKILLKGDKFKFRIKQRPLSRFSKSASNTHIDGIKPIVYHRDITVDIESKEYFVEWIIENEMLEKVKNAPDGDKRFTSEIYGGMYFIEFIRNGSHFDFKWRICATPKGKRVVNLSCTLTATMGITHEVMEFVCYQMGRDLEVIIPMEVVNVVKQYSIPGKQVTRSFTEEFTSSGQGLGKDFELKSLLKVDDVKEHESLVLKVR